MKFPTDNMQQTDTLIWSMIGVVAIAVAGFTAVGPFEIDWISYVIPAGVAALLMAMTWFYRNCRPDASLPGVLAGTAQMISFAAVTAPLSYIAATSGFPLQDAAVDQWDRHLGFDWVGMLTIVAAHPWLQTLFHIVYASFAVQTITTVLGLGFAGQLVRLRAFICAFIATTLLTIAVSAVIPAAGPWLFHVPDPSIANGFLPASSTSWPVFLGLRNGTLHTLYGLRSEGIITFPSLHAGLAVLFTAALWRLRGLRWPALLLNALMIAATPLCGSHYVVDVIAGSALAAVCWIGAMYVAGRCKAPGPHAADPGGALAQTTPLVPRRIQMPI
ncbi:MAG: phosphatase PAP2 family protein [Proteobacteria bacterium]|nr:phosphatase PAP2 family protein [Pseudomonadota bacterium]